MTAYIPIGERPRCEKCGRSDTMANGTARECSHIECPGRKPWGDASQGQHYNGTVPPIKPQE